MTVYVAKGSDTVLSGLSKMKTAMIEDYVKFMPPKDEVRKNMCAEYADTYDIRYG